MKKYQGPRPRIPASIVRDVYIEAGHECTINGCEEHTYLEIHHINNDREDNRKENLILLCDKHHKMAHDGKIDVLSLRAYKEGLRSRSNMSGFIRGHEGDRVLRFVKEVVNVLSYQDCDEVSSINSETGYRFEQEIYIKLASFFERIGVYDYEMRSYDASVRETQDLIVDLLRQLLDIREGGGYIYDGGCWARFVPRFLPGERGYDEEINTQRKMVNDIIMKIQSLMRELWDYTKIRSR